MYGARVDGFSAADMVAASREQADYIAKSRAVVGFRVDGIEGSWRVVGWGPGIGIDGLHIADVRTCSCAVAIRTELESHELRAHPNFHRVWPLVAERLRARYGDDTAPLGGYTFYSED